MLQLPQDDLHDYLCSLIIDSEANERNIYPSMSPSAPLSASDIILIRDFDLILCPCLETLILSNSKSTFPNILLQNCDLFNNEISFIKIMRFWFTRILYLVAHGNLNESSNFLLSRADRLLAIFAHFEILLEEGSECIASACELVNVLKSKEYKNMETLLPFPAYFTSFLCTQNGIQILVRCNALNFALNSIAPLIQDQRIHSPHQFYPSPFLQPVAITYENAYAQLNNDALSPNFILDSFIIQRIKNNLSELPEARDLLDLLNIGIGINSTQNT
jgi:hypothetical protein